MRELAAWLLCWLGAGVVLAASAWLCFWRFENELSWRHAAFPGLGLALLVAGVCLRPAGSSSRAAPPPQS